MSDAEIPDTAVGRPLMRAARMTRDRIRGGLRVISDIAMPPLCLACRAPVSSHESLCVGCWTQVTFIRPPLCDVLGAPMPFGPPGRLVSAAAVSDPPYYDRARAVSHYDGVMRELVHDFKFADRHDARGLFANWLFEAGKDLVIDADVIVPVPLARWRLLWRRFNQSAILAQDVARLSNKPFLPHGLDRIRRTKSQVGLSRAERRLNVEAAFAVSAAAQAAISGRNVVLVDDIITTGATVGAAAKALKRAGARRVDVLALAMVIDAVHNAV